jgi:hypothetical protein
MADGSTIFHRIGLEWYKASIEIRRNSMELKEAIMTRYSCRSFKPEPVPEAVIQNILTVAARFAVLRQHPAVGGGGGNGKEAGGT